MSRPLADYEAFRAWDTLPAAPGWSYRGVPAGAALREVGQTVEADWLVRTSPQPGPALYGADGLSCVLGEGGRLLPEGYVGYRAGTRFAVGAVREHAGVRCCLVLAVARESTRSLLPDPSFDALLAEHVTGLDLRPAAEPPAFVVCGELSERTPARLVPPNGLEEPGMYAEWRGAAHRVTSTSADEVTLATDDGPVRLRKSEVDRAWSRRVVAVYRGALVSPVRVVDGWVGLLLDAGQAEADRLGFDGDQYNGWHGSAPVDEVAVVRVEDHPLPW